MGQYPNLVRRLELFDLVVMVACFTFAAVLTAPAFDVASIRGFFQLRITLGNIALFGVFVAIWHLLCSACRLYEDSLDWSRRRKAIDILIATSIGTCAIVAVAVPFDISFVDTRFMLIFWTSVSILMFGGRLAIRSLLLYKGKKETNLRRVLIVGTNSRSIEVARKMESNPLLSSRLIGFVDDTADHAPGFEESGYELVAGLGELADYLGKTAIDEVLVCLPVKSRSEDIRQAVAICEEQGISVGILRDLFELNLANSDVKQVGDQTIFMLRPHAIHDTQAVTKRSLDILISAVLIVLLSPVFVVTALLVKLTSPGPISYDQERVGLNKKTFRMHKFRTMVADADRQQAALELLNEADGPAFKIHSDPRVTPLGRFLRKFSIDEMPQLFNVLRGEMSLVGPRPLPLRDYAGFSKDWHRRRVSVRPGITGLWQVESRDHNSFEEWIRLDLEYIDRWSLFLDFKIMLKTILAVLKGSGS